MVSVLRALVVINLVLHALVIFLPCFDCNDYTSRMLMENAGHNAIFPFNTHYFYDLWHLSWVVASIGVFFIKRWAKYLFLALFFSLPIVSLVTGFRVASPFISFMEDTIFIVDTLIVGILLFSPLSERFHRVDKDH